MTDYGTALKNLILRSKTTHTETTYTDVYSAGAYARFVVKGEYNNAERNRVVYENDVRNWIRAFDIQLTDEQNRSFKVSTQQKINYILGEVLWPRLFLCHKNAFLMRFLKQNKNKYK